MRHFHLQVRTGLSQLCQRVFGSNGLVQAALPGILKDTPEEYLDEAVQVIKVCATSTRKRVVLLSRSINELVLVQCKSLNECIGTRQLTISLLNLAPRDH